MAAIARPHAPDAAQEAFLHRVCGTPDHSDPATLRVLAEPSTLHALLADIRHDEAWCAAIAARSYRHVLGFDKFVLMHFGELGQLRMHVWHPGRLRPRDHVHNHRFAFSSSVVLGELRNHIYVVSADGQRVRQFREVSRPDEAAWRFEGVGPARVERQFTADLTRGSSYSMSADLLHRTEVTTHSAVTLVLQHRTTRDWSSVFMPESDAGDRPFVRRSFGRDEFRNAISDVLHALGD
jgi:hypothetical protein